MRGTISPSLPGGLLALAVLLHPRPAMPLAGGWGVIFAIDAPWRLEPIPAQGGYTYGKVPIVVSFRQAINEMGREYGAEMRKVLDAGPDIWVGKVTDVEVVEYVEHTPYPTTSIRPAQFREIERKRELSTKAREPSHEICRPFLGEACDSILYVTDTDEWHAVFWYTPRTPMTPGRNLHLQVTVVTVSGGNDRHEWTSSLVVHAGEAPLPRFGDGWLYGDLHYHSQMTGNEGEYGHAYRNVARMLGALGIDFVFTTDHASNGEQSLGRVTVGRCGSLAGSICSNYDATFDYQKKCTDEGKTMQCQKYSAVEARDLNQSKFAAAKWFIYKPGGANDAVARDAEFGFGRLRSANILPQLYLGEEVDAQPEMSAREFQDGVIYYGDGLKYPWPDVYGCLAAHGPQACRNTYSQPYGPHDFRSYIVRDSEGTSVEEKAGSTVDEKAHFLHLKSVAEKLTGFLENSDSHLKSFIEPIVVPARQHLVYLPTDASLSPAGWIASDTTRFGGAGKHLEDVIREVEANKGYTFLAHPLVGAQPGGPGPDVVPYSDIALDRAWSSTAVLGLQFWNEDYNRIIHSTNQYPTLLYDHDRKYALWAPFRLDLSFPWTWEPKGLGAPPTPQDSGPLVHEDLWLYDGAYTWDRYLRKGLNPADTARLKWLPKGEPRKWYMAGGSDAHGDFNYRITGQLCEHRWCIDGIEDAAIAKTRDLVQVSQPPAGNPPPDLPSAKRYTHRQVIDALRAGRFSVTNGPAIRIAIDKNRNGRIDDGDFPMGSTFDLFPGEQIPLLVEWESTPEFGPLAQIDVYVGTPSSTFAPKGHGPVIPTVPYYTDAPLNRNRDFGNYRPDPSGALQVKLVTGKSDASTVPGVSPEMRLHGIAQIFLSPQQFGISSADHLLFYVRAFARTRDGNSAAYHKECPPFGTAGSNCGSGRTYSNPIWGRFNVKCPTGKPKAMPGHGGHFGGLGPKAAAPFLDADGDGVPDICERDVPDPCAAAGGGPGPPPPSSLDPGQPAGPPQKVAPATSCQVLASLVHKVPPGVPEPVPGTFAPP